MMTATKEASEMTGGAIADLAVLRYVLLFPRLVGHRTNDDFYRSDIVTVNAIVIHIGGETAP
jgi:hypothetical protein